MTDQETNGLSYIDLMDALTARELPSGLPQLFVATVWRRSEDNVEEELRARFRLLPPGSNKPLIAYETDSIQLRLRHRVNLNLQGARVNVPGEYTVAVDYKDGDRWRTAVRLPLIIRLADQKQGDSD